MSKELPGIPQEKFDLKLAITSLIVATIGAYAANNLGENSLPQLMEASAPKLPDSGVIFDRLINLSSGK